MYKGTELKHSVRFNTITTVQFTDGFNFVEQKQNSNIQSTLQQNQDYSIHPRGCSASILVQETFLIRITQTIVSLSKRIPIRIRVKMLNRTQKFSPLYHNNIYQVDRTDQRAFADGFNFVEQKQNSNIQSTLQKNQDFSLQHQSLSRKHF